MTSAHPGLAGLWRSAVADEPRQARILAAQTSLLIQQASTGLRAALAAATAIAVAMFSSAGWLGCTVWVAALVAGYLLRQRLMERAQASGSLTDVVRITMVSSALLALVITAPCPLFFPNASAESRALLTMMHVAWATAGMAVLGVFPVSYKIYLTVSLTSIGAAWWLSPADTTTSAVVSVAMVPLWLTLTRFADRVGLLVGDSVDIRHERELLVRRLEVSLAETQAAQQARSRFLASASHDLLQPVHAMLLLTGLSRDMQDGPRRDEVLGQIHTTAEAIESMFRGLLDLARFEAGTLQPELETVRADQVLRTIHAAYDARCAAKGLRLCIDAPEGVNVLADAAMLDRVLRNLVDNAIKFTPHGEVVVRCRREAQHVLIDVTDTGVGISADDLGHVREAFYRGSAAREVEAEGVGLGLANSTQMVALLGGSIDITSEPGRGTHVHLRLPAAQAPAPVSAAPAARKALRYGCIALIEDDRNARQATVLWLQEHGARVVAGASADAVLAQCEAAHLMPEFVLSDFHLGTGEDGLAAIRRLRQRFGPLPAALVSGEPLSAASLPEGIPLLAKPLRSEQLAQLLQRP